MQTARSLTVASEPPTEVRPLAIHALYTCRQTRGLTVGSRRRPCRGRPGPRDRIAKGDGVPTVSVLRSSTKLWWSDPRVGWIWV